MTNLDAMARFREEQRALAEELAEDFYRVTDGVMTLPADEEEPPASSRMTVVPNQDDPAEQIIRRKDFVVWVLEAVQTYTDWLASEIFRANDFASRPLPEAPPILCTKFGRRYGRPESFVWMVSVMLRRQDRQIPILGQTTNRVLTPNADAIRIWATYFTWS